MRTYLMANLTMLVLHLLMLVGPTDTRVQCITLAEKELSSDNGLSKLLKRDDSDGQTRMTKITQTRRLSELLLEDGERELITNKSRHNTTPSRFRQNTTPSRSKLGTTPTRSRKKRATLVWPSGSIFEVEFFLTIPITAPAGVTIPFTLDVPYRFKLPNLTTSNFLGRGQSHKDDRLHLYGLVEGLFEKFGVDGRACVLRAVCEHAQTHLLGAGILGEVISTILAASSASSSEEMHEYVTAEFYGKSHGNCRSMYPTCPISFFSWLD